MLLNYTTARSLHAGGVTGRQSSVWAKEATFFSSEFCSFQAHTASCIWAWEVRTSRSVCMWRQRRQGTDVLSQRCWCHWCCGSALLYSLQRYHLRAQPLIIPDAVCVIQTYL